MIRRGAGDLVADQTVHGSDIDDAAVLRADHRLLRDSAGNAEGSEQVDVHLIAELLVRDILSRGHRAGSCVVDQDIDPSELLQDGVNHFLDRLRIGDVAADRQCLHAILLGNLLRHGVNHVLSARNRHDRSTLVRQRLRHLYAKACGAPCHNRYLSVQVKIILQINSPFCQVSLPRRRGQVSSAFLFCYTIACIFQFDKKNTKNTIPFFRTSNHAPCVVR